jgi:hypothetical protein
MILTVDMKRDLSQRVVDTFESWIEGLHDDAEAIQVMYNIFTEYMDRWNTRVLVVLTEQLREDFGEIGIEVEPIYPDDPEREGITQ